MNSVKLNIGSVVRLALGVLAGYGFTIASDQVDTVIKGVEQIISTLLIIVPIIWSWWKNRKVAKALKG